MGFGGGHMQDMLNRIKQNKMLAKNRRRKGETKLKFNRNQQLKFPKLSEARRAKRKQEIFKNKRTSNLILITIAAISIFLLIVIWYITKD